jgi:hypothetical protein
MLLGTSATWMLSRCEQVTLIIREPSIAFEPDRLADENDVDSSLVLLVDLEDLADAAVLAVGFEGARVLQLKAVLVDPLVRRGEVGLARGVQVVD